jgi:hypothetical protein
MAVSTVNDVIRGSLQLLGIVAAGEPLSSSDADLGLEFLNGLLGQFEAEQYMLPWRRRTTATLTASQSSFTVGSGGDINIVRPVYFDQINYLDTSLDPDQEFPLVSLSDDAYASLAAKAQTATTPSHYYYNPLFTTARGTLIPYPIPTSSTLQWVLYTQQAIARFAALTDSFSLPPAWERMLRTNLAVELAGPFEKQPPPWIVESARESKAAVRRSNLRVQDMSVDAQLTPQTGRYNIYTDT